MEYYRWRPEDVDAAIEAGWFHQICPKGCEFVRPAGWVWRDEDQDGISTLHICSVCSGTDHVAWWSTAAHDPMYL